MEIDARCRADTCASMALQRDLATACVEAMLRPSKRGMAAPGRVSAEGLVLTRAPCVRQVQTGPIQLGKRQRSQLIKTPRLAAASARRQINATPPVDCRSVAANATAQLPHIASQPSQSPRNDPPGGALAAMHARSSGRVPRLVQVH